MSGNLISYALVDGTNWFAHVNFLRCNLFEHFSSSLFIASGDNNGTNEFGNPTQIN